MRRRSVTRTIEIEIEIDPDEVPDRGPDVTYYRQTYAPDRLVVNYVSRDGGPWSCADVTVSGPVRHATGTRSTKLRLSDTYRSSSSRLPAWALDEVRRHCPTAVDPAELPIEPARPVDLDASTREEM